MNKAAQKHMKLCAVVLYIALACTCVFSSVLSYYSVTRSATADARIAIYAMGVSSADSGNGFNHTLSDMGTRTSSRTYTVTNKDSSGVCQVAMRCYVKVELSAALPSGTTISLTDLNGGAHTINGTTKSWTGNWYTFPAGTADTRNFTLTVTTNNGSNTAVSSGGSIGITVSVISEQVP